MCWIVGLQLRVRYIYLLPEYHHQSKDFSYFKVGCKWNIKLGIIKIKIKKFCFVARSIARAVIIRYPMKKKRAGSGMFSAAYRYTVIIEFNGDMVPIMKAIKNLQRTIIRRLFLFFSLIVRFKMIGCFYPFFSLFPLLDGGLPRPLWL